MNDIIEVVQLPVIVERLHEVKEEIDERTSEALSLVCTADTVQGVKKTRADLNRTFYELEQVRKAVKKSVMVPYEAFEAVYKDCVTVPMRAADAELRRKIADTEAAIKAECEDKLRTYYAELLAAAGLDWPDFDRTGVKVDMASAKQKTPKKLMEDLRSFVYKVAYDLKAISTMEHADEIAAEYRSTLSIGGATLTVLDRHKRIAEERKAAERRAAEEAEREARAEAFADSLPAAVDVQEEQTYTMSFTVRGTMEQLKQLKRYLQGAGLDIL